MKSMTMRERILAVVQGKQLDRVPFILYEDVVPTADLVQVLGAENFGLMRWSQVHKEIHPNCRFETHDYLQDGAHWQRNTLHTPVGNLYEERVFEPVLNSSSIRKHYLTDLKDYPAFWFYLNDCTLTQDYHRFRHDEYDLGDTGYPLVAIERTPYQQMWIIWAGLDNLSYHWADDPETIETTFELLAQRERKLMEIAVNSPAAFIDFPDNITADAIGVTRFKKYCVPFYDELAAQLTERGGVVFVHMDGNLRPLWPAITASGVGGLDSFSPAPDNDTTVAEAVALWPEKRLFINFPSSVHLLPADEVRAEAESILETAGHTGRLQMQISENVPPFSWRTSLPQIVGAVNAFKP